MFQNYGYMIPPSNNASSGSGEAGQDGTSAYATVEDIEGGAKITCTDANGTTTATVYNGQDGQDGAPGAAATIEIGTVTTGAAGTNASVTNVGTESAAVLNFVIPRGADGSGGSGSGSLPTVTEADNGKVLGVVDGAWDKMVAPGDETWELITNQTLEEDVTRWKFTVTGTYKRFYVLAMFEIDGAASSWLSVNGLYSTAHCIGTVAYGSNLCRLIDMYIDTAPSGTVRGYGRYSSGSSLGNIKQNIGSVFCMNPGITDPPVTEISISNNTGEGSCNILTGSNIRIWGVKAS